MFLSYVLLCISFFASGVAMGHARFKPGSAVSPPRNESTGLKSAPCGLVERTANPKIYKSGEEITVEWEETINHPGYFTIKFSKENDTRFDDYVLASKIVDVQNAPVSGPAAYHQYSAKVKLPNVTCEACTIQLIQVMEENPAEPSFYYSCSDVKLVGGGAPPAAPGAPGESVPSPRGKPAKPESLKIERVQ